MKINAGGKNFNLQVGVYANTDPATKEIKNFINQTKKTSDIKLDIKVNSQGRQVVRQIKTETGDLITITKQYDKQGKLLNTTVNKLSREYKNLTTATKQQQQAQQALNASVNKSKNLFNDFTATFLKMAKFNTINMIYDGLINKMSEAIQITNDFNKAMTEFKKVTDTSNLSLSDYTETLGEYGEVVARTTTEMLEAATEFSKAGFTPDDAAKLAQVASLYQNIADAEISAGESASFIISQMKAFDIETENATSILDKVNEVSNSFSVSSTDITSALTKQSASLAAYGNNLDKSIALVTSGTEIMTGQAGKVARGLRTIGANIVQLAQQSKEFEITVGGATKTIQLWNDAGTDMLDTYDVLKQISDVWDEMSNAEKSSLAIDLAKKTQMDTFLAVLSNFDDAEKAYVTSLTSEGSALKENAAYMESIEAHIKSLQQQWEQLALSAPFEDLEKTLLEIATAILKFANSDVGKLIIQLVAVQAATMVFIKALVALKAAIVGSEFASFISLIAQVAIEEGVATAATGALTMALEACPLFWGALAVTGIYLIIKGLQSLTVYFEEQIEVLQEYNKQVKNTQDECDALVEKINQVEEALKDIEDKKLQITDEKELENLEKDTKELKEQEALLKSQLALKQAQLKAEKDRAIEQAQKARNTRVTYIEQNDNPESYDYGGISRKSGDVGQALKAQMVFVKQYSDEVDRLTEEMNKYTTAEELASDAAQETARQLEEARTGLADTEEVAVEYRNSINEIEIGLGSLTETEQEGVEAFDTFFGKVDDGTDANETLRQQIEELTNSAEAETEAINDTHNAWSAFIESAYESQSAYETLNKAAEEYNKNGELSASTLKKLSKLSPEYVAQLQIQNGEMVLTNGLLQTQFNNEKELAKMHVKIAANARRVALCNKYMKEETEGADNAASQAQPQFDALKSTFNELAKSAQQAGNDITRVRVSLGDKGAVDDLKAFENELKGIADDEQAWLDSIDAITLDSVSSATSAAGKVKDAWVEAFEEEQRQLKHALETNEITEYEYYERLKELNEKYFGEISGKHQKYIKEYQENEEEIYKGLKSVYDKVKDYLKEAVEQGYEDAINALKKEEKNVLAEIKKQIEAIKNEKQSVIKGIEKQINALKREKEAVQKSYNAQIDAIKRENEELQKQNELLEYQQALEQAKAQKVMVMKDGRFQLSENESAVAQAEQNLGQYQEQLSYEQQIQQLEDLRDAQVESIEARIESLEEYKDYMEEYYDEQIEAMENYYNQVQEQYEKQIDALQEQLDAFKAGYKKSEDLENARLATQVLGANEEASIWAQRLKNLAKAVTEYNKILALAGKEGVGASSAFEASAIDFEPSSLVNEIDTSVKHRASGDASFASDEVALVGESPNAELVIGSQINRSVNNGSLVHLSKGSGVVNAESTRTLAGLLNGLGSTSNVSNSRLTNQNFNFGNITLPNVTDANSFVNTLSQKFNNYAIQYSNTRK